MELKRQQTLEKEEEEAAREAIHAHYNCNGKYPCGKRDYCEYCNGHNTAFDCCECGADEFKEGFIAGVKWMKEKIDPSGIKCVLHHAIPATNAI